MTDRRVSVGVVAYSHAPEYGSSPEREASVKREHDVLSAALSAAGFQVLSPLAELRASGSSDRFGISTVVIDTLGRRVRAAGTQAG